jgi:YHS domain-containing protein
MTNWGRATRTLLVAFAFGLGAATLTGQTARAAEEVNIVDGYAVHGYDVVAYFTDGKPTEGDSTYTADYNGATYRFASAANRDAFAADPGKYAPQYGGYCAYGTAQGRKFDGDPTAWRIVDDKLYLNLNANVQKIWLKDVPGYVRGADNNWLIIRPIPDSQLASTSPDGITLGAQ